MKKIVISENQLRDIITESIHNLFEQYPDFDSLQQISHGKILKVGEIICINNMDEFKMYAQQIWDMLVISYSNIGGIKSYRNYNDFLKKKPYAKIVIKNNEIFACATYRNLDNALKMVAIGCDQSSEGKMALQQIIQDDIINFKLGYWAEVSGAIEHYFKKYNGFPIPNVMAEYMLGSLGEQVIISNKDDVHYDRPIGGEGEIFQKMIFGFRNEVDFQEMLNHINNYTKFMTTVNNMNEHILSQKYSIKQCYYIINSIYSLHEEMGFNELLPDWHQALLDCMDCLMSVENKTDTIWTYLDYINYLIEDMPVLQLHKIPEL